MILFFAFQVSQFYKNIQVPVNEAFQETGQAVTDEILQTPSRNIANEGEENCFNH